VINRIRQQWEELGNIDPYWAVLAEPGKINGKWDKVEFFQTGIDETASLLKKISRHGIQLKFDLALDYGCGVGRLSRALSAPFQQVLGIDMSEAMLAEARHANADIENIQFLCNNGENLVAIPDGTVDFIYSNIVLQHAPRKVQRLLVQEFFRVLRPGATLVFQTPSHPNIRTVSGFFHLFLSNRVMNIVKRLRYGRGHVMEMHTIRKNEVLNLFKAGGMSVFEVERYDSAGAAFVSYRYFAVKI